MINFCCGMVWCSQRKSVQLLHHLCISSFASTNLYPAPCFVRSFVASKHVLMAPSLLFTTDSLPTGTPSGVCTQNPTPEFFIRWLNCKLEQLTIQKTVQSLFCRRVILCWGDLRRCLARSRPCPPRPLPRHERCPPHDPLRRPPQHPEPSLQQQP